MKEVINIEQKIVEKVKTLPSEKQQQVLNFIEFLQDKLQQQELPQEEEKSVSFLEAAREFIGCVEGPSDLSLKKRELKGHKVE